MICDKCNHDLPDDSVFCQYCGCAVEKNIEFLATEKDANRNNDDGEFTESTRGRGFLRRFFQLTAEDTVMEESGKNQPNHEGEADFGIVEEKPVYTYALESVSGEIGYLSRLCTENGEKVTWERLGSKWVEGIDGIIDIYKTYLPSGEPYKTIYINMYGVKTSETAPAGFRFDKSVFELQDD